MKYIFCRHGETYANVNDTFQGVYDSPLTLAGRKQAKLLNLYFKKQCVNKFIISPYPRVLATYKIASQGIQAKLEVSALLREISYGNLEGKPRSQIDKDILTVRKKHRFTFKNPGEYNGITGESYEIAYNDRVKPFLDQLLTNNRDGVVVVIAHQGIMIGVRKYFLNLTIEQPDRLRVLNDEIFIVEKTSDGYQTRVNKLNY